VFALSSSKLKTESSKLKAQPHHVAEGSFLQNIFDDEPFVSHSNIVSIPSWAAIEKWQNTGVVY